MNKKFSTLIASVLLTGFCSVTTMAHADEIPYRTQSTVSDAFDADLYGVNKIESTKWYQLEVTPSSILMNSTQLENARVLVQYRDYGTGELRLKVVDQNVLDAGTVANQGEGSASVEPSLNSSLWKIDVVDKTLGSYLFKFTNKETGYELSYNCVDAVTYETAAELPSSTTDINMSFFKGGTVNKSDMNTWRWYTSDVQTSDFGGAKLYAFNHNNEKVLGLALDVNRKDVILVDMPKAEVGNASGEEMIPNFNVLKFTVRNAGARVLNAADINSMIDADNSWMNRANSALTAKFKEVTKPFSANEFFTTTYKALDTNVSDYANTAAGTYAGYSIVLMDNASKSGEEKYFMVATDDTYEADKLPSEHGGLKVLNNTYDGDVTAAPMNALKARYHWKVTYYPTPDSLVFEPLNASIIGSKDKQDGKKWKETPLVDAQPSNYYNTINATSGHPIPGYATGTTSAPSAKDALEPVALTLMNNSDGSVLTVGRPEESVYTSYSRAKYGKPVVTTGEPAIMGLKIQFNHTYTYLKRASKADDVYFIQISVDPSKKTDYRKDGMYLVYNMEGRLMYDSPDDYQDYEQMPATQWVIERDTCHVNGGVPYVKITNREYLGNGSFVPTASPKGRTLFYGQLYNVEGTDKYYIIRHEDHDVKSDTKGIFANTDAVLSCGDTIYFTPVKATTKANPYLGYKRFNHDNLKYETYAMKYLNATTYGAPNTDNYLSIDENSKFLSVNSIPWNDYEIDTLYVDKTFGYTSEKAGAVQLKRTVYALKVRDNNLIDNQWRYVVVADDGNGNTYYQMAHLKDVDGKNVKLGTFYFKADQITADETPETAYALVDATGWSKEASFKKEYWVNGLKFAGIDLAAKDSMLVQTNPDDIYPYLFRKYSENGFRRVDVKDQTTKTSFMTLNNGPMDRVSAFVFDNTNRPLYGTLEEGNVNIYRQRGSNAQATEYLFEDSHNASGLKAGEYINGFRYLSITAENVKPVGAGSTTAMYVDPVIASNARMPKYLLFVDKDSVADGRWCKTDVHGYFPTEEAADAADKSHHVFYNGYVAGRVLVNLNDSVETYEGHNMLEQAHKYGFKNYTRLGFVEAIHMNVTKEEAEIADAAFGFKEGEYLFVFNGTTLADVTNTAGVIDPKKLVAAIADGTVDQKTLTDAHQNIAFSVRLTEDDSEDILLESAGLGVTGSYGTFSEASWVQVLDGVPVLAQKFNINGDHTSVDGTTTLSQLVSQAQILKIGTTSDTATSNESIVVTDVKVIAGNGTVTILNAAGKTVAISNILGQTVAKQQITSDNATIAAPKGIVVVAVEGETAIKAIVK